MVQEEISKVLSDIRNDTSLNLKENLRKYLRYEIKKARERLDICEEKELKYLQGSISALKQVMRIILNKETA